MAFKNNVVWFRPILERAGPFVEGFTAFLSVVAVVLILLAQFPHSGPLNLPVTILGIDCATFIQDAVWGVFVIIFALYGFTHRNPLRYAKKFWLELVVCLSWIPFFNLSMIHIHSLVPLVMIGTLAHLARAARWVMRRFAQHPLIVLVTLVAMLVTVASALLMKIEPETFTSFQESMYFVYMTALTLGGKFHPNTLPGEIVVTIVATAGVGIVAVVIGSVREFMQRFIFGDHHVDAQIIKELKANGLLLQEVRAEQKRQAEVYEARLAALEQPKQDADSGSATAAPNA